jgi:hypothetical protein
VREVIRTQTSNDKHQLKSSRKSDIQAGKPVHDALSRFVSLSRAGYHPTSETSDGGAGMYEEIGYLGGATNMPDKIVYKNMPSSKQQPTAKRHSEQNKSERNLAKLVLSYGSQPDEIPTESLALEKTFDKVAADVRAKVMSTRADSLSGEPLATSTVRTTPLVSRQPSKYAFTLLGYGEKSTEETDQQMKETLKRAVTSSPGRKSYIGAIMQYGMTQEKHKKVGSPRTQRMLKSSGYEEIQDQVGTTPANPNMTGYFESQGSKKLNRDIKRQTGTHSEDIYSRYEEAYDNMEDTGKRDVQ